MTKDNASVNVGPEGLLSVAELKGACKDAETRYLKQVFRETYVEKLRTTNLIDHLEHMAMERRFYDDAQFKRLIKNLKDMSRTLGALINGEKGERLANNALRHLFVHNATLHGVCLEFEGELAEIDYTVITRKGIFLIEVKYYTFDAIIDSYGTINGPDCHWAKPYSVGEKLRTKEYVLSRALGPELGELVDPANIHSMILFANGSRTFTDEFGCYPACCCGDVAQKIEGFEGEEVFTDEQIERVKSAILTKTFVPRYPSRIDFGEIEADLGHVMELIGAGVEGEPDDAPDADLEYEVAADDLGDVDILPVASDTGDGVGWLWVAGSIPVALLVGYGFYRHPSAIRKLARLIHF